VRPATGPPSRRRVYPPGSFAMAIEKIAIITGGGDCGGLNAVIKGAAMMAHKKGIKSYVIPNGYAGLYNLVNMDTLVQLTPERLDPVSVGMAGSEAGHSRVKIAKIKDPNKYDTVKAGLQKFGIDALVISGGDDTGTIMLDLIKNGIKCIHAPKTMDLDLMSYSVGADSTINRIREFVRDLSTTGRTHNRILVVEVFGRYAGHTAFRGGIAAGADAILIPEVPVDFDLLWADIRTKYFGRVADSDVKAGTYIIVVSEGLKDASGSELVDKNVPPDSSDHFKLAGAGKYVRQELELRMKADPTVAEQMKAHKMYVKGVYEEPEIRTVVPEHLVRCGFTSSYDVKFGHEVGAGAVLLLAEGIQGVTVTNIDAGVVKYMNTEEAIVQRHVNLTEVALYEQLGYCFGHPPPAFAPTFERQSGPIRRIYK